MDEKILIEKNSSPKIVSGQLTPGAFHHDRAPAPGVGTWCLDMLFLCCCLPKSCKPGAGRPKNRVILKNGDWNIQQTGVRGRGLHYLQDIFTTLVDIPWRWTFLFYSASFITSWIFFALVYWWIVWGHGDLNEGHLPDEQADSGWAPCINGMWGFPSAFLYSLETQSTIGYGGRMMTEECPIAVFIMVWQVIFGLVIDGFCGGVLCAKLVRSKYRTQTLQFSHNAVVCQRDGSLCIMFRIGDICKSILIGSSIRAQVIRPKKTKEGEILSYYQTELSVSADSCDSDLFFIWPMTIVHKIDEDSPFYNLSASELLQDKFEIVVILEGTVESTGQSAQARTSYVASEILWGHKFEPVVAYSKYKDVYEVNYSKFDCTVPVDTPLCSAAQLDEFYKEHEAIDA